MSSFEIVDRRKLGRPEEPKVEAPAPAPEKKGKSTWRDLRYVLAYSPLGDGSLLAIGRAVGLRSDGVGPFTADFWLPKEWGPYFLWQGEAKKRIDTFLYCGCNTGGVCKVHQLKLEEWKKSDQKRMEFANSLPLPEAIELLVRAERASQARRQQNIVVQG